MKKLIPYLLLIILSSCYTTKNLPIAYYEDGIYKSGKDTIIQNSRIKYYPIYIYRTTPYYNHYYDPYRNWNYYTPYYFNNYEYNNSRSSYNATPSNSNRGNSSRVPAPSNSSPTSSSAPSSSTSKTKGGIIQ